VCPPLAAPQLDRIRRTRRHPRRTQPDYLILRYLVNHLERVLDEVRHPVDDVLDLFCGTQPYRDHLPPHTRYVAMDIDDTYGMPDVVSGEFLPFPDDSFDLVLFTEAFHYVTDPHGGVEELRRVLRPGGTLVLTMPLVVGLRPPDRRAPLHRPAARRAVQRLGRGASSGERRLLGRVGDADGADPARARRARPRQGPGP